MICDSHDVGFVNGRDTGSLVIPGVLECILSDAPASILCDQFNTLHNSIHNLIKSENSAIITLR